MLGRLQPTAFASVFRLLKSYPPSSMPRCEKSRRLAASCGLTESSQEPPASKGESRKTVVSVDSLDLARQTRTSPENISLCLEQRIVAIARTSPRKMVCCANSALLTGFAFIASRLAAGDIATMVTTSPRLNCHGNDDGPS